MNRARLVRSHRMRNAALVALFGSVVLGLPLANAQTRGPRLQVDALPSASSLRYEVRGPSTRTTSRGECADTCAVASEWWEGPGEYALTVETNDARQVLALPLRGHEEEVLAVAFGRDDGLDLSATIFETDPRVRVRVGDRGAVEVINDSDRDLEVVLRDGYLNWSWQDEHVGPTWPQRVAAGGQVFSCGLGLSSRAAPARSVTWVGRLHPVPGSMPPGRHFGSVALYVASTSETPAQPIATVLLARFRLEAFGGRPGRLRILRGD